jgi:hypothetical protein
MANKILFNSKVLLNGTTAGDAKVVYRVPFTFDNNGYTHLHEPRHNLSFEEQQFKDNIVNKIEAALTDREMFLVTISFSTMNMVVGIVQDRN